MHVPRSILAGCAAVLFALGASAPLMAQPEAEIEVKTGGPCFYTGRDMAKAHEGTGVSPADWERATELMAATLDARGVQGELRNEVGTFLAGLREDIVDEK